MRSRAGARPPNAPGPARQPAHPRPLSWAHKSQSAPLRASAPNANVRRIKLNAMQRVVGLAGRPAAQSRARTRVRMIELGREYGGIRRELLSACERVLDRMQLL